MKRLVIVLTIGTTILSFALPAFAVTAWWSEPRMLVQADEAIIPVSLSGGTPDAFNPNDTMETAHPLRVGAKPLDRVITAGYENWYVLQAEDGPGYIRIGATGPIMFNAAPYVPGKEFGPGGMIGTFEGPEEGAA